MTMISVIIPVLNEAQALREHLPALQPLRARGHELIVVDGGEDVQSKQACSAWVDRWISSDAGRALQMNAGAAQAHGEGLLFLHIDTLLPATAAEVLEHVFSTSAASWGRFDVRLSGSHPAFRVIETMINLRSRVSGVATGDQALFVRREVFARAGGFPRIPLMEDVALSKRLRSLAWPVCLRERVTTSSRRWERHGIARTVCLMWWLRLLYVLGVAPQTLHRIYIRKPAQHNEK